MKYAWVWAIKMAVVLALSGTGLRAADTEQRLAVVNVSLVFEKYNKVPDIQRRADEIHKEQKIDLQKRATDLGKRHKELQEFFNQANTTEPIFDAVQRLRKDQFTFERDLGRLNAEIQKEYTRDMREVLNDIRSAVRIVAEKGNFTMVLRSPSADDPDMPDKVAENPTAKEIQNKTYLELTAPQSAQQIVERFNRNPVLFGAQTVDITQAVLDKLNDEYIKRSAPAGAGVKK